MSFRRKRPVKLQPGPEWSPLKEEPSAAPTPAGTQDQLLSVTRSTPSVEEASPMKEHDSNVLLDQAPTKRQRRTPSKPKGMKPEAMPSLVDFCAVGSDEEDSAEVVEKRQLQQVDSTPIKSVSDVEVVIISDDETSVQENDMGASDEHQKGKGKPTVLEKEEEAAEAEEDDEDEDGEDDANDDDDNSDDDNEQELNESEDEYQDDENDSDDEIKNQSPESKLPRTKGAMRSPVDSRRGSLTRSTGFPSTGPGKPSKSTTIDDSDEEDHMSQADIDHNNEVRQKNITAMLSGNLTLKRTAVASFCKIPKSLQKPFVPPAQSAVSAAAPLLPSNGRRRTLGARRRRPSSLLTGGAKAFKVQVIPTSLAEEAELIDAGLDSKLVSSAPSMPPGPTQWEPLVLWRGDDACQCDLSGSVDAKHAADCAAPNVQVPDILCRWLRLHQREGVKFMYECVTGMRSFEGHGCILADDMGLGKTLQSITLMYTMMMEGQEEAGTPDVKKCIVVTPTSLVGNWAQEIEKWIPNRIEHIALSDSSREKVIRGIKNFLNIPRVRTLVISYETFRRYVELFLSKAETCCDLLILDEAHRLKNNATATSVALASLPCRRRVLLSGTPLQNDLEEFFAIVNFTNPGVLGTAAHFRRHFQSPILIGREPDCSDEEEALGNQRSQDLSDIVNDFILRRSNELNRKHLPEKIVNVVCIKLTEVQRRIYNHMLTAKEISLQQTGAHTRTLQTINALKKLCNHPKLIHDDIRAAQLAGKLAQSAHGFQDCRHLFPAEFEGRQRGKSNQARVEMAGKMDVLAQMLWKLRHEKHERIVIVSNYTQTLDIISVLCRENRYPFVRLDGGTSVKKRQKLVNRFNGKEDVFVFLLSSKAGGCGLNLIGGSRLILFDPDWNPATDKQAAARIWRDGQKRTCFIYRFLATGTIEEKIFERQISKEGLSQIVMEGGAKGAAMSSDDLREIFSYRENCISDTHDTLGCKRCKYIASDGERPSHEAQSSQENEASESSEESDDAEYEDEDDEAEAEEDDDDDGEDDDEDGDDDGNDDDAEDEEDDEQDEETQESDSIADKVVVIDSDSSGDDEEAIAQAAKDKLLKQKKKKRAKALLAAKKKKKLAKLKRQQRKKRQKRQAEAAKKAFEAADDGVVRTQLQRSAQVGNPSEDQIALWAHHAQKSSIIDDVLRDSDVNNNISFVFELRVPPMVLPSK